MTRILVNPTSIDNMKELIHTNVDGFIVGLKNYSIFQNLKLDIIEIKNLDFSKEIYISINKPIHNNELDNIKKVLKELSNLNINGILFEDVAIYQINKELKLNLNLIWNGMHLSTNSTTCNYWSKLGVSGVYLSNEITLKDYVNIKKNTNMIIMVMMYGHLPISHSSRSLISNYLQYIGKSKDDKMYSIYEKNSDKHYPIYEEYGNTFVLDKVLDGIEYINILKENNIDYIILNGMNHCNDEFVSIVNEYIDVLNGGKIKMKDRYLGFLFTETIYRVKNNEKA